ncbi:MAG: DUF6351 family protein, partial [Actinomycetota bacterium]
MRRTLWLCVLASLVAALPVISQAGPPVRIHVLSNRADLISGGDALVEIALPPGAGPATVDDDGRDVTAQFAMRPGGRFWGLVTGLDAGPNVLTVRLPDASGAHITIANHAIGGPIFSGGQILPWLCTTQTNGLRPAQDAQCNAPTTYELFYKSSDPTKSGFQPYPGPPAPAPADVATTTTDRGETVSFIVRRERGTANRGIHDIAVLFDPAQPWSPWSPQRGWNGKLHYPFGASCGTVHSQGSPSGVLVESSLAKGFMVANSSLNVLGSNCNTVTSAESTMMLKERIVEQYGPIRYTIGSGCSGGSIGQHMVSNAYPSLIDGIQPTCSYADTWSTGIQVADCHLLLHYFNNTSPLLWAAPVQRGAVDGTMSPTSCIAWEALFAPVLDPRNGCGLGPEEDYNPQTNPDGCRGTLPDYMISVVGARPEDGFGKLAYDNVGVQYGLTALRSRLILPEQFVDLNEKIGGFDIDINFTPGRREADPGSLRTLYQSGQINDGRQLDRVPIIDLRGTSNHEIHADYHTYVMRERLDRANGHHDNQIIWSNPLSLAGDPVATTQAFALID